MTPLAMTQSTVPAAEDFIPAGTGSATVRGEAGSGILRGGDASDSLDGGAGQWPPRRRPP